MIIYKDIISGDEMFSDTYKIIESSDGVLIEVEGKLTSRTEHIDDSLIGGNASQEFTDEGTDASTVSGVDIVLNHKLQATSFKKDTYKIYIKEYMRKIRAKLVDNNPDRVLPFVDGVQREMKKIMGNFKNYQFYTGESMNVDGMVGLLDFRDDGITPFMIFFKDGLEMEKC